MFSRHFMETSVGDVPFPSFKLPGYMAKRLTYTYSFSGTEFKSLTFAWNAVKNNYKHFYSIEAFLFNWKGQFVWEQNM